MPYSFSRIYTCSGKRRRWELCPSSDAASELTGKRLLFVDDERGIRETLAVILLRYAFTVTVAATVKEALKQVQTQNLICCFAI
jgi:ActR/RegA family two-component response regulator